MATGTSPAQVSNDEVFRSDGTARPGYRPLIQTLEEVGPAEARDRFSVQLAEAGVVFGEGSDPYPVDPLPRLIDSAEWERVSAGLAQRHRALKAFLEDAYGERALVHAGVMPARVLEESRYYEPLAETAAVRARAALAGPDLIRDPSGELLVLEDNLRTPSGFAYALACRQQLQSAGIYPEVPELDPWAVYGPLARALRAADPDNADDPPIAVLTDGRHAKVFFEHREVADRLGLRLVTPGELEPSGGRLMVRNQGGREQIRVIYNRTSQESLRSEDGKLTPLGELLAGPIEAGNLGCVNQFGAGVADDKAVHCYVDRMISFYLGEEPQLRSVPGFDLGQPEQLAEVVERLDELVIKPRWSYGGKGIVFGPRASAADLNETAVRVKADPAAFVAQPTIDLSVHPTVTGGKMKPRHIDLRGFVVSIDGKTQTLPVALTRFAGEPGEMAVNSTQGGGAKDTWLEVPHG